MSSGEVTFARRWKLAARNLWEWKRELLEQVHRDGVEIVDLRVKCAELLRRRENRMVGKNTLHLNEATLIAAVQKYLDGERRETAARLVVESVRQTNGSLAPTSFEVSVKAEPVEPPKPAVEARP